MLFTCQASFCPGINRVQICFRLHLHNRLQSAFKHNHVLYFMDGATPNYLHQPGERPMIRIDSAVKFSFLFPAERAIAYEYYSDMGRMVHYLRHISLVESESDQTYRMLYNTVELGTYHIHVYCDVSMDLSGADQTLRIVPTKTKPAIKAEVSFNSTTTRGYYSSEARFFSLGDETRIEYALKLRARPPRPKAMRFMPKGMVDKIALNITNHRVKEIADSFIYDSIDAFPLWLARKRAEVTPG